MKYLLYVFLLMVNLSLLVGCGGGGGGGGSGSGTGNNAPTVTTQPGTVTLYLHTTGTLPPTQTIRGVTATLNLPAGVNVKLKANTTPDIVGSGMTAGKSVDPIITENIPSTATTGGKITFTLIVNDLEGFNTGEFATVTCSTSPGPIVQASQFTITNATVTGGEKTVTTGEGFTTLNLNVVLDRISVS